MHESNNSLSVWTTFLKQKKIACKLLLLNYPIQLTNLLAYTLIKEISRNTLIAIKRTQQYLPPVTHI